MWMSVTKLAEKCYAHSDASSTLKARWMNEDLCERGFQMKREGKKGYTPLLKAIGYVRKMEQGKLYWDDAVLELLK